MIHRPAFGRRGDTVRPARPVPVPPSPPPPAAAIPTPQTVPLPSGHADHDEEIEHWKRTRTRHMPWRQISLMASLCFGIASVALPDTVNKAVQWPLYALAAASFYAGIRKRRK